MANSILIGILFSAGGIALLSAMDAVAKSLGASLPIMQLVFFRLAGATIWLALFIHFTKRPWPQRKNMPQHAVRGILLAITATLFFYGVIHLPIAIASALAMTAPIYTSLLGVIFLKEKISISICIAILFGLAGSLIIIFLGEPIPVSNSSGLLAWGAAILAPISYASIIILTKHHATHESAAAMSLAQSAIAAVFYFPFALSGLSMPTFTVGWQIILIGFLGALGFIFLINGLRRVSASLYSVIDYTSILWAATYGYLFFAEIPQTRFWIGGSIIIIACAIGSWSVRQVSKENTTQQANHPS